MEAENPEVIPLRGPSYLAAIRNSVGTRLFQEFHARVDGEEQDVAQGGVLSCAYYVSGLLYLFGLIERPHLTVASTVKDLEASGWVKQPAGEARAGSVLVWERITFDDGSRHPHIGFSLGGGEAVGTNYRTGQVERAPLPPDRAVTAVYWTDRVNSEGKFFGDGPSGIGE